MSKPESTALIPRKASSERLSEPATALKRDYVTISIPRELYVKVQSAIRGTGFRSVTEYAVFLIRESLALRAGESVRDRLKALGYID